MSVNQPAGSSPKLPEGYFFPTPPRSASGRSLLGFKVCKLPLPRGRGDADEVGYLAAPYVGAGIGAQGGHGVENRHGRLPAAGDYQPGGVLRCGAHPRGVLRAVFAPAHRQRREVGQREAVGGVGADRAVGMRRAGRALPPEYIAPHRHGLRPQRLLGPERRHLGRRDRRDQLLKLHDGLFAVGEQVYHRLLLRGLWFPATRVCEVCGRLRRW